MKQLKYILFIFIFLTPIIAYGQQITESQARAAYEKLKAKGYDVDAEIRARGYDASSNTNGDPKVSDKEYRNYSQTMVLDTISFSASDSIAKIMLLLDREKTKYRSIEEAAMDVNRLLNAVSEDKAVAKKMNGGLGFKIAQRQILNKEKDKIAKDAWVEMVENDTVTIDDFSKLYERFGDKPTFYIGGYEVTQEVLNKLRESDVLTREYRITNTASGNPNGEIWYEITSKAARRIKFYEIESPAISEPPSLNDNVEPAAIEEEAKIDVVESNSESAIEEKDDAKEEGQQSSKNKKSVRKVKENINNK